MTLNPRLSTLDPLHVAILHGAGYAGGELLRLLLGHPYAEAVAVTSRSQAGKPVWTAHPSLRGQTDLAFIAPDDLDVGAFDAAFVAAEHGQGAAAVVALREHGFGGPIIDLSADHRFRNAAIYPDWFGFEHPAPDHLAEATYGLVEVNAPYADGTRLVANPGCFATGLALALHPLAANLGTDDMGAFEAHVTALTGASGSGTRPKTTTHFPTRSGNVRAYKVLRHQHLPEVEAALGVETGRIHFVPTSGPWTRGIWGTAHATLPSGVTQDEVGGWYEDAYADKPLVRFEASTLPELLPVVGTPFCDLGVVVQGRHLVVGFALDNLLKGAASQAVQNLNLVCGLPETAGLLAARYARVDV
ncbi:MAG: N-acetyl-gamma-glutamyl-phosphate reductase [Bacteroidota bacterium]